jgi:glycosyltransferase involved in cell wall biosynthesis
MMTAAEALVETAVMPVLHDRKIRIAFVGLWYPLWMGRYMYEALARRPDVELWTAGPYTARWIPWNGGMYLPASYVYKPDCPFPLNQPPEVNYDVLAKACPHEPDIWIEANAGLIARGRPRQPYIVIGTDPHVLEAAYATARRVADAFYCTQKPYMKPGDKYIAYAYDPVWHTPTAVPVRDRRHDVSLVGLAYEKRVNAMTALRSRGCNIFMENGPAYEDAKAIYHQSKIGLNWSSLEDTTARVFEVMAFGIAPLLNRVPDLMEIFKEGQDFEGFGDESELVDKAMALLKDPDRCQALGEQARKAVEPHSWDARMDQILREWGLVA